MEQIKKILKLKKADLKSVYLIYSEDYYQINEFIDKFVNNFINDQEKDFNLTFLEEDEQFFGSIKSRVNTLPVFADKRFVIGRCKEHFTKKSAEDQGFIKLFNNFPESSILIIAVEGKIDKRLKVISELKKIGEIIEFSPLKYRNLDQWIKEEFHKRGKIIDTKGIKFLEQMFNNNLQRLESEIEKIVTYNLDKDLIRYQDLQSIISKDRLLEDNIIFSLVDALSERKKKEVLILLNEMINAGEIPMKILAMIIRQVRLLLLVKVLKQAGNNPDSIAKILKEHPYPIKKCYNQSDNFTEEKLELLLERFLQVNLEMITGKYNNDDQMAIEMALFEL